MQKDCVVIKCGGSTLDELTDQFYQKINDLKLEGKHPVIVHGGGPEIKKALKAFNVHSEFIDGLRKTTGEVMDVVEMILAGRVNKRIVNKFQGLGIQAIGLSGSDGGLIKAQAIDPDKLGFVGDVKSVRTDLIENLIDLDVIPVIAPIGLDENGSRFNINADTAAGAVAEALGAESILFVTNVPGILKEEKLLPSLTHEEVNGYIADGTIHGGMLPKVKAALAVLERNLKEVKIVGVDSFSEPGTGAITGTAITKTGKAGAV